MQIAAVSLRKPTDTVKSASKEVQSFGARKYNGERKNPRVAIISSCVGLTAALATGVYLFRGKIANFASVKNTSKFVNNGWGIVKAYGKELIKKGVALFKQIKPKFVQAKNYCVNKFNSVIDFVKNKFSIVKK